MKRLLSWYTLLTAAVAPLSVLAGPESLPSGKEMKQVAPAPLPAMNWTGFYFGLHIGGQFGHSETNDLDDYYFLAHHHFGYDESGIIAGGQVGYNLQLGRFVIGPEFDLGYLDLDGHGQEPEPLIRRVGVGHGSSDGDFYTTLRGRVGYAVEFHGPWLLYATGGAIGVNYFTRFYAVENNQFGIDAHTTDFDWGYTVGAGIERRLGEHWSLKIEYLYFNLGEQPFSAHEFNNNEETERDFYRFQGDTMGHIIRAGLNFHF